MTYVPSLVKLPTNSLNQPNSFGGFPSSPFSYFLFSAWVCLQTGGTLGNFTFDNFFTLCQIDWQSVGTEIHLGLFANNATIYDATYSVPAGANVYRSNLLVSIDASTHVAQVYLNDQPLTIKTINVGWNNTFLQLSSTFWSSWKADVGAGAADDIFCAAPNSFFDLTDVNNRRKFINADLTAVDLRPDASAVLGSTPPIFLTVQPLNAANDIATNYGTGGAWTITPIDDPLSFQGNLCQTLPNPQVVVNITGVSASAQVGALATSKWAITSNIQSPFTGAVGDVWANNSYIDFSDPSVRANFENADGSWLDLGYNGTYATGSSPLLYLTVQPHQPPSDILTGYGQDGLQTHWVLLDHGTNPSTGQAYPAMSFDECATAVGNLELTDIEVIATSPTIPDNEVTLRWSDDAGASWSNGLLRSLGQAGEYFTAPTWYRLGMSRNRIIELSWSGARAEALQGVFVEVTISAT